MKYVMVLFFICSLTACSLSSNPKPDINIQNLQYSYFEQIYNDSQYIGKISSMLRNGENDKLLDFSTGYITAIGRDSLYDSVEAQALEYLKQKYNEELALQSIQVTNELRGLIWSLHDSLQEIQVDAGSPQWVEFQKTLAHLSKLLWESNDGLWATLAYPKQSKDKFGTPSIENSMKEISSTIKNLINIIHSFPNKIEKA